MNEWKKQKTKNIKTNDLKLVDERFINRSNKQTFQKTIVFYWTNNFSAKNWKTIVFYWKQTDYWFLLNTWFYWTTDFNWKMVQLENERKRWKMNDKNERIKKTEHAHLWFLYPAFNISSCLVMFSLLTSLVKTLECCLILNFCFMQKIFSKFRYKFDK